LRARVSPQFSFDELEFGCNQLVNFLGCCQNARLHRLGNSSTSVVGAGFMPAPTGTIDRSSLPLPMRSSPLKRLEATRRIAPYLPRMRAHCACPDGEPAQDTDNPFQPVRDPQEDS